MPRICILPHPKLCQQGTEFEAQPGASLCECLLAAGVAIEHACDGVAACATCHVHIRAGGSSLSDPDNEEMDQLDNVWGLDTQSRLACCVRLGQIDITVELPRHSRNHARER